RGGGGENEKQEQAGDRTRQTPHARGSRMTECFSKLAWRERRLTGTFKGAAVGRAFCTVHHGCRMPGTLVKPKRYESCPGLVNVRDGSVLRTSWRRKGPERSA